MLLIDSKYFHLLGGLLLKMKSGREVEGSREGVCFLSMDKGLKWADKQTTYSTHDSTSHPSISPV
jgi:hypothetical protein